MLSPAPGATKQQPQDQAEDEPGQQQPDRLVVGIGLVNGADTARIQIIGALFQAAGDSRQGGGTVRAAGGLLPDVGGGAQQGVNGAAVGFLGAPVGFVQAVAGRLVIVGRGMLG